MSSISFALVLVVLLTDVTDVRGEHIVPTRVKRGIFGTVTSTVFKTIEEKHYVPASCVRVAPNLPECRHVRFLYSPGFNSNGFNFFTKGNELLPTATTDKDTEIINSSGANRRIDNGITTANQVQGWGEYLGFYRPTVTVTEIKIKPTTVLDTRIMVTYDIRGCKPHQLPYNLEKCVEENSVEVTDILPTSTVRADIRTTELPEKLRVRAEEVEGTEAEADYELIQTSTKSL